MPRHEKVVRRKSASGFTLLEAVVVIGILALLAGLIVPRVGSMRFGPKGQEKTAEEIVTISSMQTIRAAILGAQDQPGLWQDMGQRPDLFPQKISDLFSATNFPITLQQFDPVTRLGWRGPYLMPNGGVYSNVVANGFTSNYGTNGEPAMLDAWGHSIVIQIPQVAGASLADELLNARLVSAGQDGIIQTPIDKLTPADISATDRGDDVILFLRVPDQQ